MELSNDVFRAFLQEDKIIDNDIEWKMMGGRYKIENIEIITSVLPKKVVFGGQINDAGIFCFWIMYMEEHIVRYDQCIHPAGYNHPCIEDINCNVIRNGRIINEKHKHKFKEKCPKNLMIKIIPDSEINPNNVNEVIFQFFKECKIRHEGGYTSYTYTNKEKPQKIIPSFGEKITKHIDSNGRTN